MDCVPGSFGSVSLLNRAHITALPTTWLLGPPFPTCCPGELVLGCGYAPHLRFCSGLLGRVCCGLPPLAHSLLLPARPLPQELGMCVHCGTCGLLELGQAGSIPGVLFAHRAHPSQSNSPFVGPP